MLAEAQCGCSMHKLVTLLWAGIATDPYVEVQIVRNASPVCPGPSLHVQLAADVEAMSGVVRPEPH